MSTLELSIGGTPILPGERPVIDVPVAPMYTHDDIAITVQAMRGKESGPTLFISADFDCICDPSGSFAVYLKTREDLVKGITREVE